jgi:hypothetical protein
MPRKTSPTTEPTLPVEEKPQRLIPHDTWCDAHIYDVHQRITQTGKPATSLAFQIDRPYIYRGQIVWMHVNEGMTRTLDNMEKNFGIGDMFGDADYIFKALNAYATVRIHVVIDDAGTYNGVAKPARNRVVSVYPPRNEPGQKDDEVPF